MTTPNFAETDHYEFQKWATETRKRLQTSFQNLFDVMDDPGSVREAVTQALAEAEGELAVLHDAKKVLPKNLASMLGEYTDVVAGKLTKVIPRARQRIDSQVRPASVE